MAWHILHGMLEQVREHSTFSGKIWIFLMFIFRIVVVARIGDNVYHDEQSQFVCNTLTPGCLNVCFNKFRPISQLRFWSFMVLVVATPSIVFFLYASHKIYHAHVKFPEPEKKDDESDTNSTDPGPPPAYIHPPSLKRKRSSSSPYVNATAPQLFVMKRLNSKKDDKPESLKKHKTRENNYVNSRSRPPKFKPNNDEDKDFLDKRKGSTTDNNYTSGDDNRTHRWHWANHPPRLGYPIYSGRNGKYVEYIKSEKAADEIKANKIRKRLLENPQLYRIYWWHVVFRTLLEACFLYLQYYLYGFTVPELYPCERWPCPKTVDCFVSRPMEKSCLMWLMFGLGAVSCLLSIGEFWSLGWEKFKYAVCCRGQKMTYQERRERLAILKNGHKDHESGHHKPHRDEILMLHHGGIYGSAVSLDSQSSETTVESV